VRWLEGIPLGRGSATTAAAFLGRRGIGIDLSTDYKPVAEARVCEVHERFAQMVVDGKMTAQGIFEDDATA
jgi:hypothetical protein